MKKLIMKLWNAIDWKAGLVAAGKAFLKVAVPSAVGAAAALGLAGCSTQIPRAKGPGVDVFNVGFPIVMWFTTNQEADNGGEDTNAAMQANPVTPTVAFPVK